MRVEEDPHFTREEFQQRLERVHSAMATRSLDCLLLSDPCNLYYVSGYDAWSFYVPQVLIVERGSDRPLWIGRQMDAEGARLTTWLGADAIEGYPDQFVQSASAHPMAYVAQRLRERGLARARIGVELSSYYLGAKAFAVLQEGLPQASWEDASLLVNWLRVIKSPDELRYMREAARIVENAMNVAVTQARPGVRQCDVAAEIYRALIRGTPDFGGQYTSSPPLMPAGERVNTPHLSWTSDPYEEGMLVNFELVAARHRYHTPLARSLYLGTPVRELRDLERAFLEGIEAALQAIRPGITAEAVERHWQSAAGRHGVTKSARCGYSIGIAYPPTFGEQTVSLRPGDTTVLQPNMTLHLMPAVWERGRSMAITEPLVVTEHGCEPLCRFERRLFSLQ
jgi:Xaa-Pro aminopeptidase